MNRSDLKNLIQETVEEVMNEFAPLGVAEEKEGLAKYAYVKPKDKWIKLNEKAPPHFPKKLHDKLLKQYKGEEDKAYATMWKIFYKKEQGDKKINEMWTAWESKGLNEAKEKDQNEEHDETDLSNPEEAREVELAKKIKALANDLLKMHGTDGEESEEKPDSN